MFSHIYIGISEFDKAFSFYQPLMASVGVELRFYEPEKWWAGWHSKENGRPLFVIAKPYDGQPHHPGNGQMVAFLAHSRQHVRDVYQTAIKHGAVCEGAPGLRPQYHAAYYGAYFRDLDGNKLCIVSHADEGDGNNGF